jgi:inosine-uridine nucleoside N-ribohydrolase
MQLGGKPPVGILFDSDIGVRIDSVLALALLYGLEGKSEARVIGLSVSIPNLGAAQFCEVAGRFYAGGPAGPAKSLHGLPIGLATDSKVTVDTHAVNQTAIRPNIQTVKDTADPRVLIRNALTAQYSQNAVIVCAGPATNLAAVLELGGAKDLIAQKVRFLAIAAGAYPDGGPESHIAANVAAAKRVFAEWPTPVVASDIDVLFPGESIEKDFAYTHHHPIADAYRAYRPLPYDAAALDMSAVLYAVRPNEGYFKLSEPGTIAVDDEGRTRFAASSNGKHRYLIADPEQKQRILKAYIELASAKPVDHTPKHNKQ